MHVTVKFINRDGEELTRRYNSSEPLYLKINEHKRSVTQYTNVFPEWQISKKIKVFNDLKNTLDILVGKAPPISKIKNRGQLSRNEIGAILENRIIILELSFWIHTALFG